MREASKYIVALMLLYNCRATQDNHTVLVDPSLRAAAYSTAIIELLVDKSWDKVRPTANDTLRSITMNHVSSLNFHEENWDNQVTFDNTQVIVKSKSLINLNDRKLIRCIELNSFIKEERLNLNSLNEINCDGL